MYWRLEFLSFLCFLSATRGAQQCADGWLHHGEKCYFFTSFKASWPLASSYCLAWGGKLAEPVTEDEEKFLGRESVQLHGLGGLDAGGSGSGPFFFIGVVDHFLEGNWVYASTKKSLDVPALWWRPNDNFHDEDCAIICGGISGKWADEHCNTANYFVCEYQEETEVTQIIG